MQSESKSYIFVLKALLTDLQTQYLPLTGYRGDEFQPVPLDGNQTPRLNLSQSLHYITFSLLLIPLTFTLSLIFLFLFYFR